MEIGGEHRARRRSISICDIASRFGRGGERGYNTAAMSRLRHLLARRADHPLLSLLILCLLAFRLIFPTGLMLDPDADGGWAGLAICSGHGPLDLTPAALQANEDLSRALGSALADARHASPARRRQCRAVPVQRLAGRRDRAGRGGPGRMGPPRRGGPAHGAAPAAIPPASRPCASRRTRPTSLPSRLIAGPACRAADSRRP
ncbi:hypothetical protein [Burkholderia gladioli]|uniref:hypothetical protein n=1 Tax=Burkholderia gladioli TaxID=28095 RepID=UPI0016430EF3|nr:hypothetical protein [Burkholderia gladioli]